VHASHKNDIEATREDFHALSDVLIAYVAAHKDAMKNVPLKAYCPMADAAWLQTGNEILNPYMGTEMLHCGSFKPLDEAATASDAQ